MYSYSHISQYYSSDTHTSLLCAVHSLGLLVIPPITSFNSVGLPTSTGDGGTALLYTNTVTPLYTGMYSCIGVSSTTIKATSVT